MKFGFYSKLAWMGMAKNKRLYLPYLLTCVGMVAMFYILAFLADTPLLKEMSGGASLQAIMGMGRFVIAVFAVIFLFYTNSFLIRRRKTEFGLYNILGMGKKNIGRILLRETLIIGLISLVAGLGAGIALSKLAELGLVNIAGGEVTHRFTLSFPAISQAAVLFAIIFLLILLNSLRQVYTAHPAQLLRSENLGEKPPKANWFWALLGAVLLAVAYYLAVSIQAPLSALTWFFVAVTMVIIGTYLLFISGSVLLCRILQKRKGYYYRPNHFVSVSSMVYRMKRNGAGLASICILATMVLVMITGSACLYFGAEDSLHTRYPYDIAASVRFASFDDCSRDNMDRLRHGVDQVLEAWGEQAEDVVCYRRARITVPLQEGVIYTQNDGSSSSDQRWNIMFVPVEDYNRMRGTQYQLAENQVMIYAARDDYPYDTLSLQDGTRFQIARRLDSFPESSDILLDILPSLVIIVPHLERDWSANPVWYYGFDLSCSDEDQKAMAAQIRSNLADLSLEGTTGISSYSVESLSANRADFYSTYGGVFFLGIMLSIVFLFATVLMIYYKQISEGYEDQSRFDIMQKVGMTKGEIRTSINSQMLTVFFLPLGAALLHLAFAFPMLRRLLLLFDLRNLPLLLLTAGISVLIFAVFYALVYRLTSNAYYTIVSGAKETR